MIMMMMMMEHFQHILRLLVRTTASYPLGEVPGWPAPIGMGAGAKPETKTEVETKHTIGTSSATSGVCEQDILLIEPRPCDPAAEVAIQPKIGPFKADFATSILIRKSEFVQRHHQHHRRLRHQLSPATVGGKYSA